MSHEKRYPASQNKVHNLRKKGVVPHKILPARLFCLGILILSGPFFLTSLKELVSSLGSLSSNHLSFNINNTLDIAVLIFIKLSLVIFFSYFLFSFIATKFLILPFGRYPEGVRRDNNKISIKSEFVVGIIAFVCPALLLIFSPQSMATLLINSTNDQVYQLLWLIGTLLLICSTMLLVFNNVIFRLSQKMDKLEILAEALEGQMTPSNRASIEKARETL